MKELQCFAKSQFTTGTIQTHLLSQGKRVLGVKEMGDFCKNWHETAAKPRNQTHFNVFFLVLFVLTGNISIVPGGPGNPSAPGRPGRPGGPYKKKKKKKSK